MTRLDNSFLRIMAANQDFKLYARFRPSGSIGKKSRGMRDDLRVPRLPDTGG
jgi:hypothetical protein